MNIYFYEYEFMEIVGDILNLKEFQDTKNIKHHGNGVYEHCVKTSYLSYKIAKILDADYVCAARAGMLHDFFYHDWRSEEAREKRKKYKGIQKITKMHGFTHPFEAYERASKYFFLSDKEHDAIIKHMFPLVPLFPMHLESWIVSTSDKIVAIADIYHETIKFVSNIILTIFTASSEK